LVGFETSNQLWPTGMGMNKFEHVRYVQLPEGSTSRGLSEESTD